MRRAFKHHPAGSWDRGRAGRTVTLAWEERRRRRIVLPDDAGEAFLLDLPVAVQMADGDGLETEAGDWIAVRAGDEDIAEVSCGDSFHLARIAYHIGNRHMPVQILPNGRLRLPWDHVVVDMVRGLGARVERMTAPFHPEGGAYAQGGHGPHSHGHHSHGHHSHDDDGHRHA